MKNVIRTVAVLTLCLAPVPPVRAPMPSRALDLQSGTLRYVAADGRNREGLLTDAHLDVQVTKISTRTAR